GRGQQDRPSWVPRTDREPDQDERGDRDHEGAVDGMQAGERVAVLERRVHAFRIVRGVRDRAAGGRDEEDLREVLPQQAYADARVRLSKEGHQFLLSVGLGWSNLRDADRTA